MNGESNVTKAATQNSSEADARKISELESTRTVHTQL